MESQSVTQRPLQFSSLLVAVFAAVCGVTVANIYYAQALCVRPLSARSYIDCLSTFSFLRVFI